MTSGQPGLLTPYRLAKIRPEVKIEYILREKLLRGFVFTIVMVPTSRCGIFSKPLWSNFLIVQPTDPLASRTKASQITRNPSHGCDADLLQFLANVESPEENDVWCVAIFPECSNERILNPMTLHAHAEALYADIQSVLGQHDANQVQAKLEHALRHVIPNWNHTTPDCPGWYWFKGPGVGEPQLLHVTHGRIDTKLMADLGPPNNLVDVQRVKGQWAGPLLPPT